MSGRQFCVWLLAAALMGTAGLASARTAGGRQVHVVYAGQRLGSIAKRYNVSIEAICQANGIRRRDPIRPGQRLEIPSREEARGQAAEKANDIVSPTGVATPTAKTPSPSVAKQAAREEAPSKAKVPEAVSVKTVAVSKTSGVADKSSTKIATLSKVAESNTAIVSKTSTVSSSGAVIDPVTALAAVTGVSHRVRAGESLSAIAAHYDTNVKTLLQVNNLSRDKVIRVGQVLTIPRAATTGTWWGKFARSPRRAGEIEVFAHTNRWKGAVVVNGKVQSAARAALSRLLGATGSAPPIPERLIQLLAHVSDTFGGRPVRLVSGYRMSSYVKDSRHRHSSAVDFSIPGVPNSAVRDYLLQLGNVGVGYYPNSTFVHLDVRARSAYWVDYAGPGEAPRKAPRADRRLANNTHHAKPKRVLRSRARRTGGAVVAAR